MCVVANFIFGQGDLPEYGFQNSIYLLPLFKGAFVFVVLYIILFLVNVQMVHSLGSNKMYRLSTIYN